jgi:hypothetical protein
MTFMANQHRLRSIRVLDCPSGSEYDEETFRYFLGIEQARAARANHPLRLLLATLETSPGQTVPFTKAGASRLFDALRLALRDTDVMGWYRQSHVAGAVLTVPVVSRGAELSEHLERRIGEEVRRRMPSNIARLVRVRVINRAPSESGRERGTA